MFVNFATTAPICVEIRYNKTAPFAERREGMKKTTAVVGSLLLSASLVIPAYAKDDAKPILFNGGPLYSQAIYKFNPDTLEVSKITPGSSVDISPNGENLAFIKNDSLYISDINGKNQIRLTDSHFPNYDASPRWSPDGKKIVFSRGDGNLYVIDVKSKQVKPITHAEKGVYYSEPDFSPDGSKIVCHASDATGFSHIYLMDADGSNLKQLTGKDGQSSEYGAHFSPDGSKILFGRSKNGNADIYVMNADGSHLQNLTADTTKAVGSAIWSDDGSKILYTLNHDGIKGDNQSSDDNSTFYEMNANGSDKRIMQLDVQNAMPTVWKGLNLNGTQSKFGSTLNKIKSFLFD